jgi:hypothetical protein
MRVVFVGSLAVAAAVAALLATVPSLVAAQSLRCRNDLANVGDNKAAVSAKCGEPVSKESYCRAPTTVVAPGSTPQPVLVTPCETVDEWTYRPGPGQFMTTLKFESGKLRSIEYGARIP